VDIKLWHSLQAGFFPDKYLLVNPPLPDPDIGNKPEK
jgi:hypothetical protein